LAQPRIVDYIRGNFEILQLNIIGARKVTDFDGAVLSEKAIAAKYGVRYTPTIQFFPETPASLKDKAPDKREVARATGYMRPDDFLAIFRFVREKAYERGSFRDYLKAKS
jgi:thioredoxin-related protein